jgi:hypothetical protein
VKATKKIGIPRVLDAQSVLASMRYTLPSNICSLASLLPLMYIFSAFNEYSLPTRFGKEFLATLLAGAL